MGSLWASGRMRACYQRTTGPLASLASCLQLRRDESNEDKFCSVFVCLHMYNGHFFLCSMVNIVLRGKYFKNFIPECMTI